MSLMAQLLLHRRYCSGFTIAELLVTLGLLGIIVSFTIPKIIQAGSENSKKTVFMETYSSLCQIVHEGMLNNEFNGGDAAITAYIARRLNAIKLCPNNYVTEGCYIDIGDDTPAAGMVMPNGAIIIDLFDRPESTTSCAIDACEDNFRIDWNGINPPNRGGVDRMELRINVGQVVSSDGTKPGSIIPYRGTGMALFQEIIK